MNERIKLIENEAAEFADQAWMKFRKEWPLCGIHNQNPPLTDEIAMAKWRNLFREKFAELLVQDCVNIINNRADTSADYLDSKKANDHARQVQRDCATTLEYAYGLKEMEMAE